MTHRPRVLMVTGTYLPRINGAVLQCAGIIKRLSSQFNFEVLTGCDEITGGQHVNETHSDVPKIYRVIKATSVPAKVRSVIAVAKILLNKRFEIVHFHGFSSKVLMIGFMAKLLGSKIALKCTSLGVDDAETISKRGLAHRWFLLIVDAWICPSPAFIASCRSARLPAERLFFIPNAVDSTRFRPGTPLERMECRARLKLAPTDLAVLFVGHFSRDKRPDFLFESIAQALVNSRSIHLILIGETSADHYEVDAELIANIRNRALTLGVQNQMIWISRHEKMEDVFRAADVFALPSVREGMPNALTEAMSCGLASVAMHLPGVTDWMLDAGNCGLLVPLGEGVDAFGKSISALLNDAQTRITLGRRARQRCLIEFSPEDLEQSLRIMYEHLMNIPTGPVLR